MHGLDGASFLVGVREKKGKDTRMSQIVQIWEAGKTRLQKWKKCCMIIKMKTKSGSYNFPSLTDDDE